MARQLSRGRRRSLRLVAAALTWLAISAASLVTGSRQSSVCDLTCCQTEPSCVGALHLICRCQGLDQIYLSENDLPSTLQSISISEATKVTIAKNSVLALSSLMMLELKNIDVVELLSHGLALERSSALQNVQIENVRIVNVSDSALSGFWERGVEIRFRSIAELLIQSQGLSYGSSVPPTLSMDHIAHAAVHSNGIMAPITALSLANVNLTKCHSGSLGNNVSNVHMEHVNIKEMEQGCIVGAGNTTRLSLNSCIFGTLGYLCITGEFSDISLSSCNITAIRRNGVQLKSRNMSLTNSLISDLMSHGMNVTVSESFYIQDLSVGQLRKRGLVDIKTTNSRQTADRQLVRIHGLKIARAEEGSLTLARGLNASLLRLDVNSPESPICPTERWVRWLVEKDTFQELSPPEHQMTQQLYRRWLCPSEEATAAAEDRGDSQQETNRRDTIDTEITQQRTEPAPVNTGPPSEVSSPMSKAPSEVTTPVYGTSPSPSPDEVTTGSGAAEQTRTEPTNAFKTADDHEDDEAFGESQEDSLLLSPSPMDVKLVRRLQALEKAVSDISGQNENRTIREIIAFTVLVLYFVFKAFRWMEITGPSNAREGVGFDRLQTEY